MKIIKKLIKIEISNSVNFILCEVHGKSQTPCKIFTPVGCFDIKTSFKISASDATMGVLAPRSAHARPSA